MKIRAALVHEQSGPFEIEQIDLEEPRDDEVLVAVAACGLCHTDLLARDQHVPVPLPAVFGHEGAGVVAKVGSRVRKVAPGDHVVASFMSCGSCDACAMGSPGHCSSFFRSNFSGARLDGSATMRKGSETVSGSFFGQSTFASHAVVSERNVVKVPESVPLEIMGPLGCSVSTGAGAVMNSLRVRAGSSIAVFGVGSVGMSAILAANVCGCSRIIAVDINGDRLEIAKSLGATDVFNSNGVDVVDVIKRTVDPGVDYSLECVGMPKVLRQAVDVLASGGTCGLVGVTSPGTEVSLDMQTILGGRTVLGIVEGDAVPELFVPKLMDLYTRGRFPFDRMIRFYPFDKINEAAEDSEKGRVLKAVLRMQI